jgi:hypothetical protein
MGVILKGVIIIIDRSYYNFIDSSKYEKKLQKASELSIQYSLKLFSPKNYKLLVSMLPAIEHSVKNKKCEVCRSSLNPPHPIVTGYVTTTTAISLLHQVSFPVLASYPAFH